MKNYIVRGILIGGSLGAFAAMFGLLDITIGRGAAWGMIGGFLAGITLEKKRERENKK